MGKTVLYHPVSLMTIRGAAANCGFEFGRITQTSVSQDKATANYRAVVKSWPVGWDKKPQFKQKVSINECFNIDIWCTWAGINAQGELCVNLMTQLTPDDEDLTQVVPDADYECSEDA